MSENLDSDQFENMISPSVETAKKGPNSVPPAGKFGNSSEIFSDLKRKQEVAEIGRVICGSMDGKEDSSENEVEFFFEARNQEICEGRSITSSAIEEKLESVSEDMTEWKQSLLGVEEKEEMVEKVVGFDSEVRYLGNKKMSSSGSLPVVEEGCEGSSGSLSVIEENPQNGKVVEFRSNCGDLVKESSPIKEWGKIVEDEKNSVYGAPSKENSLRGLEERLGTSLATDGKYETGGTESEFVCQSQYAGKMPNSRQGCDNCESDVKKLQERALCEYKCKGCENNLENASNNKEKKETVGKAGNDGRQNVIKETVEHEGKLSTRRVKHNRKGLETVNNGNKLKSNAEVPNVCEKEKGSKRSYLRSELEALRYVKIEEQQSRWNEIYLGLGPVVSREFDQISLANQNQSHKNAGKRQSLGKKKEAAKVLDEVHFQSMEMISEEVNSFDFASGDFVDVSEESRTFVEEACDEDENSDDEYDNIQRPAFLVEGEPDFESGPPQDGLEYLRRVRWEAAKIPKVKVAKLDKGKLNREQTAYMPNIPDIAKCPEQLMPSKQWEDAFLADFSELRQALSQLEGSSMENLHGLPSPALVNAGLAKIPDDLLSPKSNPTMSVILCMDAVSRAKMLRSRINSLQTAARLSRGDCLWVFALSAAVDVPLDAEMSASLRCLLRKCASLRAGKSELDDEVVMLNMLVAISGKYFRQSED
ncbi:uncharacterized protein LOC131240065 [Magnolia sinica]|uniref:uncharacterized protein LOC131240065 n=1 Tax=Magnolia sinica TaxID=86752 RepID=UPI002659DF05|nr:uncharacterized protein LOC131240065 [Magnolia sinica]XP_058094066.1 uncharacterized protein LOC131240065 [Magnolia sinica]XP_058094067.1 uncharacterized protein LOC131240065 [Magnolia sinica]XP_058094068.1 uncharacterized protein LOC131240065 [Magnolia sinica]